jgi:Uma2 family endonuclease
MTCAPGCTGSPGSTGRYATETMGGRIDRKMTSMAMVTAKQVYTLADLPEGRVEHLTDILKGQLVVFNVPDDNHDAVVTELFSFLIRAMEAGYGQVSSATRAVALDFPERGDASEDVTHPDLFFVLADRVESLRGRRALEGVPDLVIEIFSRTTRAEHRPGGGLWQAYERHGLPHYWLVDTAQRTISQYTLSGEPYVSGRYAEPVVLGEGDTLTSPLFPTVSMAVSRIFQRVRDRDKPPRSP